MGDNEFSFLSETVVPEIVLLVVYPLICSLQVVFHANVSVHCSPTFIGEVGGVAAQDGEGVMRRERRFTDGRNKSVTRRHQTQTAAQRCHG